MEHPGPHGGEAATALLLADLGGRRIALRAEDVRGIIRAVAVLPLPGAPYVVEGLIDVGGRLTAVFDLRPRFRIPPKPVTLDDHFILARCSDRDVAIRVDRALDLVSIPAAQVHAPSALPRVGGLAGVVSLPDGLVLVHDLAGFLTEAESVGLDKAMSAGGAS